MTSTKVRYAFLLTSKPQILLTNHDARAISIYQSPVSNSASTISQVVNLGSFLFRAGTGNDVGGFLCRWETRSLQ